MLGSLEHRGPDDLGVAHLVGAQGAPAAVFGHTRLAILDLSPAGHQPMQTPDGRLTITFNGEIYNYRELRAELARQGATFRSHSDTEVILVGWMLHGTAFLERLRGMYAFAIWDRALERGCLVRDPLGIKPLYVAETPDGLLFASELRAILASGRIAPRLSRRAVSGYLTFGAVPEPDSIIEGVRVVPAGEVVSIARREGRLVRIATDSHSDPWARREPVELHHDPNAAAAGVRSALRDSVAAHLVSDLPVGFFLSGGIDSSVVVGLAAELASGPVETFTVTFAEAAFDEAAPAQAVVRRFGTSHSEIPLSASALADGLPGAFAAMDQPTIDGVNTYVVSQAVRAAGLKVVLSGLGGDELFAGYPSFARARRLAPLWRLPSRPREGLGRMAARFAGRQREKIDLLFQGATPAQGAYRASRLLLGSSQVAQLCGCPYRHVDADEPEHLSPLQAVSRHELTGYTRDMLLRDSDVFSMAHGLELRVPFLDREVLAAANAVDDRLKLRSGVSKPLLLAATRDLLPREVWDRPKRGFVFPLQLWLSEALRDEMDAAFSVPRLERVGLDPGAARAVWAGYLAGRLQWSRPWALYVLIRWAESHGAFAADPAAAESAVLEVVA